IVHFLRKCTMRKNCNKTIRSPEATISRDHFISGAFECMIRRAMTNIQFQRGLTMVAQREPQHMTIDEWRELERTSHDIKHEYIDGLVYAMAGGSLAHGRI